MNDLHSGYLILRSAVMSDYEPTSPHEALAPRPRIERDVRTNGCR